MPMSTIHPFEEHGFGKAPYRFDGVTRNWFCACPGDPGKPGGSCDFCGQGIAYEYWVISADGRKFKVGCDCIAKLARKDNVAFAGDTLARDADIARRRLERERRFERQQAALAAQRAQFSAWYSEDRKTHAATLPHPVIAGLTLADYIGWMLDRGYALTPNRFPQLVTK
jgi:hypothetical protein